MPREIQNTVPRYFVHIENQKNYTNGRNRQRIPGNQKRIRHNKSRRLTRVYLIFYSYIQQEEI